MVDSSSTMVRDSSAALTGAADRNVGNSNLYVGSLAIGIVSIFITTAAYKMARGYTGSGSRCWDRS